MAIPARAFIDNDILLHMSDSFWIAIMLYPIILTAVFFVDRHRWSPVVRHTHNNNNNNNNNIVQRSGESPDLTTGAGAGVSVAATATRSLVRPITSLFRGETLVSDSDAVGGAGDDDYDNDYDGSGGGSQDAIRCELHRIDTSTRWLTSWTVQSLRVRGVSVFWAKRLAYMVGYAGAVVALSCCGMRDTPLGSSSSDAQAGRDRHHRTGFNNDDDDNDDDDDGDDDEQYGCCPGRRHLRMRNRSSTNAMTAIRRARTLSMEERQREKARARTYRKNPLRSSRFRAALLMCTTLVVWASSLRLQDEFMNGPLVAITTTATSNASGDIDDTFSPDGHSVDCDANSNTDLPSADSDDTPRRCSSSSSSSSSRINLCPLRQFLPELLTHSDRRYYSEYRAQSASSNSSNSSPTTADLDVYPIHIAFRDVGCSVPSVDEPVLSGVTGEIAPGRLTVILGPSGAGKSLFAGALLGRAASLCSHHTGQIYLNGKERSLALVVDRLGYVRTFMGAVMLHTIVIVMCGAWGSVSTLCFMS
jgi:hypothetical protein